MAPASVVNMCDQKERDLVIRNPEWEKLGEQMAEEYREFISRPGVVRRMYDAGLLGNEDKHEKTNEDSAR